MKSIEFITPQGSSDEPFRVELRRKFSGYSERGGRRFARDIHGIMSETIVNIFEVASDDEVEDIKAFAARFDRLFGENLEVKVDGRSIGSSPSESCIAPVTTSVSDWPSRFDIAVQTVIGKELHAAQDIFQVDTTVDTRSIHGTVYYKGKLPKNGEVLSVAIVAQASAGNAASALTAERLINFANPKSIFLMGICAGMRGAVKIGDVVTPRVVVDDNEGVLEAEKRLRRPKIYPPPFSMIQQLQNFRHESTIDEWYTLLGENSCQPVWKPDMDRVDFDNHVNLKPKRHESAIYSSNHLLRDANFLPTQSIEIHQQIKIGEMEAAGFGEACNARSTPTPWYIVRGVSDFGDHLKSDDFQIWAAYAAASYLKVLAKYGINFSQMD